MANFQVRGYTPQNTALESMRLLLSAYSTQLQAKRMEQDEQYRLRMERLNEQVRNEDIKLKRLEQQKSKEGLETQKIMTQTAKMNFIGSVLKEDLKNYQDGLGNLWDMDDVQTVQQAFLANVDKLKKSGMVDPKLVDLYTNNGAPLLASKEIAIKQFKQIQEQSPYRTKAVAEATGMNASQMASMGMKRFNEVYDEVVSSVYGRKKLVSQKVQALDSDITTYMKALEDASKADQPEKAKANELMIKNLIQRKSELQDQMINFDSKMSELDGTNYKEYRQQMFDKAEVQNIRADITKEQYGFRSPDQTRESGMGRMADRNLNKIDLAISRGIFDEADRPKLNRMVEKGYGNTLFDKLEDNLEDVRSSQFNTMIK